MPNWCGYPSIGLSIYSYFIVICLGRFSQVSSAIGTNMLLFRQLQVCLPSNWLRNCYIKVQNMDGSLRRWQLTARGQAWVSWVSNCYCYVHRWNGNVLTPGYLPVFDGFSLPLKNAVYMSYNYRRKNRGRGRVGWYCLGCQARMKGQEGLHFCEPVLIYFCHPNNAMSDMEKKKACFQKPMLQHYTVDDYTA